VKTIFLDQIIKIFFKDWYKYFDFEKPLKINYILINTEVKKIFVYFIANKSRVPFSFAKIALNNGPNDSLKREYRNAKEFEKIMPEFFKKRVPKILFKIDNEEGTALISSFVNGDKINSYRSNYNISASKKNKKIINDIFCCWKEFNSTNKKVTISIYELNKYFENIENKFKIKLSSNKYLTNELNNFKKELFSLSDSMLSHGPVHGDFWRDNIIVKNDNIYIIDWEKSKLNGFPIFDIYLFCFTYFDDDSFMYNFVKSYDQLSEINRLLRYIMFNAINYLSYNKYQALIMMELFLYEMCVQGYLYYDKSTRADFDWRNRLNFFLKNKKLIKDNILNDKFFYKNISKK